MRHWGQKPSHARHWLRRVLLAGLCASVPLSAQDTAPRVDPLLPICPPGRTPRVDTTRVIVGVEPATAFRDSAYTADERLRIAFYAEAITRYFVAPSSLGAIPTLVDLPAYYRDGTDDGSRSALRGRLVLIVRSNGRIRTLAWEHVPLARPLAEAVTRAAQVADSAGEFEGIMRPDTTTHGDTLVLDVRSWLEREPPRFPLMRVELPGYRGETVAMVLKAGHVDYPFNASRQRIGTEGEVHFVVGTDGRAVEELIQVTRAGWRDFVAPMRKAIANTIFEPATSGGCKVPTLARQRFSFITAR